MTGVEDDIMDDDELNVSERMSRVIANCTEKLTTGDAGADGQQPTVIDDPSTVLPGFGIQGEDFEYIYRRRQDAAARNLRYINEQTPDLTAGAWSETGIAEAGSIFLNADTESVTNHFSITGTTNRFFRMNISVE